MKPPARGCGCGARGARGRGPPPKASRMKAAAPATMICDPIRSPAFPGRCLNARMNLPQPAAAPILRRWPRPRPICSPRSPTGSGRRASPPTPADLDPWLTDWRGRWRGRAAAMLSPASTEEVAFAVRLCAEAGVALVPQGGNTSMVGGATPDESGEALILSLRRMNRIRVARSRRQSRGLRGGGGARDAARSGAGGRAALSAQPRRQGLGDDRRPGLDQCRRHPGAAPRDDAAAGAGDRGGAAGRIGVRRPGRAQEGQSRLRSHPAADRRGRDARRGHRREPPARSRDRRARRRLGRAREPAGRR